MDDRAVTELRRLAELDADLSERAAALRALDARVASLRGRAEEIDAFFASYPEAETQHRAEASAAEEELERRRAERAIAARTLADAQDDESRIHAEHALARALDHIAVAESRLARAKGASDELQREATALPLELDELEAEARTVPDVPQLSSSLVEWASHAHAELFVASGQIDVERERVIREANELASMLLGEQTYGTTVAQALSRVERFTTAETRRE